MRPYKLQIQTILGSLAGGDVAQPVTVLIGGPARASRWPQTAGIPISLAFPEMVFPVPAGTPLAQVTHYKPGIPPRFSYHFRLVELMQARSGLPSPLRSATAQLAAPIPPSSSVCRDQRVPLASAAE